MQAERDVIALVGSVDRSTRDIVVQILAEAGIEARVEGGSIVYGISAPRNKAAEAKRLLQTDPRLKDRWIQFR